MIFNKEKKSSKSAVIPMTSLMDVIFLLLCFFVTSSVFSQWETEVEISLPTAKSATIPGRLPGQVILNVDEKGGVSVNGLALTLEEVTTRLARIAKIYPGQSVIIRADKATDYEALMNVIDACRSADVWNFSLATKDNQEAKSSNESK
jgi:biopolymer transport protein ExbD